MLWDKTKYSIKLHGGCGVISTKPMHGLIQHLSVIPQPADMIWSMRVVDRDGDTILQVYDHEGRLDDRQGLAIGKDTPEKFSFFFEDSTANGLIDLILNVREIK